MLFDLCVVFSADCLRRNDLFTLNYYVELFILSSESYFVSYVALSLLRLKREISELHLAKTARVGI